MWLNIDKHILGNRRLYLRPAYLLSTDWFQPKISSAASSWPRDSNSMWDFQFRDSSLGENYVQFLEYLEIVTSYLVLVLFSLLRRNHVKVCDLLKVRNSEVYDFAEFHKSPWMSLESISRSSWVYRPALVLIHGLSQVRGALSAQSRQGLGKHLGQTCEDIWFSCFTPQLVMWSGNR